MRKVWWHAIPILVLAACGGDGGARGDGVAPPRLELLAGAVPDHERDLLVDFGNVTVGELRTRTLVLRNTGGRTATVEPPHVDAPFRTSQQAPVEVAPGADVAIEIGLLLERRELVERSGRIAWNGGAFDLRLRGTGASCGFRIPKGGPIDFGMIALGSSTTRTITVENGGLGTCSIERIEVEGEAFSTIERESVVLLPGSTLRIPVGFQPVVDGREERGVLRLRIGGEIVEIELRGLGVETCITLTPAEIDFGAIGICSPDWRERSVLVRNDCAQTLHWKRAEVTIFEGNWFYDVQSGAFLGKAIQPGDVVPVLVRILPRGDDDHSAELRVEFDEGWIATAPIHLEPTGALPTATEEYWVPVPQPLDVLVVVDDTTRMEPYRGALDAFAATLASVLVGHDFQIGVTTVSASTKEGCAPAPDGRLLPIDGSQPRLLRPDMPDLVNVLASRLAVDACQDPARAGAIAAAVRALTELAELEDDPAHPEPQDGNAGLLRPGSNLLLLFLLGGDDVEATIDDAYRWASEISLLPSTSVVFPQAWMPLDSGGFEDGWEPTVVEYFVDSFGGVLFDSSFQPWAPPVTDGFVSIPTQWRLSGWPYDADDDGWITWEAGEIRVFVDGVELPPTDGDGEPIWEYRHSLRAVRFLPGHLPPPGSKLTLTYLQPC